MGQRKRSAGKRAGRTRRPKRAPVPLTEAQDKRYSLLRRNAIEQQHIVDHLAAKGIKISRPSVGLVIRNAFVNEDVIAAFCELTRTTRDEAWPDVPQDQSSTTQTGETAHGG